MTKVVLAGSSSVGKTTIVSRLADEELNPFITSTIGAAFSRIRHQGKLFDIWDTAGQERYMSMCPTYFRGAHIVLFVFDVSDPKTIDTMGDYVDLFFKNCTGEVRCIFIGNKLDRDHICEESLRERVLRNRYVVQHTLQTAPVIFVSALTNTNIPLIHQKLGEYAISPPPLAAGTIALNSPPITSSWGSFLSSC